MKTLRTRRRATAAIAAVGLMFGAAACAEEDEGVDVDTELDEGEVIEDAGDEVEDAGEEIEEEAEDMDEGEG